MEAVTITARKVTYENVAKACEDLTREGKRPTVNAVRIRIGGGSPNEVAPLIKKWKATQPEVALQEITLDPSIARLIAQQMAAYAADAARVAEARAAEAEENVQCLTEAGQLLELRLAQMQTDLDSCYSQVQQLTGQLVERAQEVEIVRGDSRAAVQASEVKAASERAVAEDLRQELVRAQIRVESLAGLEHALTSVQHELKAANEALAGAMQSAAVSDARAVAATERAQHAEGREAALRVETTKLREEVAQGHASAQRLAATLAKVSADLAASLERQEPIKKAAQQIAARLHVQDAQGVESNPG